MMEHPKWEKDTTPYLVFCCKKCNQYSYVKTTQKTKKCLRCGRNYQVKTLLSSGEIVQGITAAMNKVKDLQNTLGNTSFHVDQQFIIPSFSVFEPKKKKLSIEDAFYLLLERLSSQYQSFPSYMIELIAPHYHIPKGEISGLIRNALRTGKLSKNKQNDYLSIRSE